MFRNNDEKSDNSYSRYIAMNKEWTELFAELDKKNEEEAQRVATLRQNETNPALLKRICRIELYKEKIALLQSLSFLEWEELANQINNCEIKEINKDKYFNFPETEEEFRTKNLLELAVLTADKNTVQHAVSLMQQDKLLTRDILHDNIHISICRGNSFFPITEFLMNLNFTAFNPTGIYLQAIQMGNNLLAEYLFEKKLFSLNELPLLWKNNYLRSLHNSLRNYNDYETYLYFFNALIQSGVDIQQKYNDSSYEEMLNDTEMFNDEMEPHGKVFLDLIDITLQSCGDSPIAVQVVEHLNSLGLTLEDKSYQNKNPNSPCIYDVDNARPEKAKRILKVLYPKNQSNITTLNYLLDHLENLSGYKYLSVNGGRYPNSDELTNRVDAENKLRIAFSMKGKDIYALLETRIKSKLEFISEDEALNNLIDAEVENFLREKNIIWDKVEIPIQPNGSPLQPNYQSDFKNYQVKLMQFLPDLKTAMNDRVLGKLRDELKQFVSEQISKQTLQAHNMVDNLIDISIRYMRP